MHVGRHTTAQSAEIQFFGVHLSMWLSVGKRMPRRNAPDNFFFRGTGLPTVMRKNQPLVPRSNIAGSWTRGGGYWTALIPDSENSLKYRLINRLCQLIQVWVMVRLTRTLTLTWHTIS